MDIEKIKGRLDFLREAEKLKDVLRSAHTSSGRTESTAEHSWRLCLMAMVFEDELAELDRLKVLKMCVIHDLGEAIHGDVPVREGILSLWDEYEQASSPEALAVKAFDKLETMLQHNQGSNPPDFDFEFNLDYGRRYTSLHPLFAAMRKLVDEDTRRNLEAGLQRS